MDNITPRGFIYGVDTPDDDREPNKAIEYLFYNNLANSLKTESLAYKRKIIEVALTAFGTSNFLNWFYNQFKSRYLSTTHFEFLLDTLHFISTGNRKFNLEAWDSIISKDEIVYTKEHQDTKVVDEFFGISSAGVVRTTKNYLVKDVLKLWVSRHNGFNDLLYTINILFSTNYTGKEKAYYEVSE